MARDLDSLLTSEMTPEEWKEFGDRWIKEHAYHLKVECEWTEEEAKERAELDFERYVGQEGYTERDEHIAMKREMKNDGTSGSGSIL